MESLGIFIVLCLIALFYNFSKANSQDIQKIQTQGGIENKFFILIQFVKSASPLIRLHEKTNQSLTFGYIEHRTVVSFFIHHSFGKVHIKWSIKSPYFGNHKEHWEFPEYYDQHKMVEEIDLKISNILHQLMH